MTQSDGNCSLPRTAAVYALRRFIDNGVRSASVYKLPPELMTSGDESANSSQILRCDRLDEATATYSHLRRPCERQLRLMELRDQRLGPTRRLSARLESRASSPPSIELAIDPSAVLPTNRVLALP